jgi:hypothetical protein
MRYLSRGARADWGWLLCEKIQDMETDSISIVLSLVALIAAVASLGVQANDLFASRYQSLRGIQLELVRMAIEDPRMYLGYEPSEEQRVQFANQGFVNMLIKYFELGFLTGALGEAEIRHQMSDLFKNTGPRQAWMNARKSWRIEATSRKKMRFVEIVEREFESSHPTAPA